jgi:chromosome segregation protein
VRLETLVTRTRDEVSLDLPARYEEANARHAEALAADPAAQSPFEGNEEHWTAIAEEIKELREKIQRLGNVNLDSLGELEELEQRQQFYATQIGDLTTSRQQLAQLIDEINRESGVRFEQTFNAVKENFQAMFRKLFGGGSADVFLETEVDDTEAMKAQAEAMAAAGEKGPVPVMRKTVDPLEAGIEIIARPPGKKPVTISQLSGGEKAMTCIALLMSIFKSKPSPFCILDEVDSPLDEANNVRFGEIVQEFLSTSQFIIITHHKRTMQIADVLYGVTQQEQGVSKRVAVKFDQVAQGGNISAAAIREAERSEVAEAAAA